MTQQMSDVLRLVGLRVRVRDGADVINDVTLALREGEIVCLVGESGSGKTTTALSAFGYCAPNLDITASEIVVDGQVKNPLDFTDVRGRTISYVPQNPATALNPSMRVGAVIADLLRGGAGTAKSRHAQAVEMLGRVGLPTTPEFARRFPHQLSGGQQQRVCIAAALVSNPKILVLDEPTTGLDVATQDRILTELLSLRREQRTAMLYVTHDLAVASQIADRIVVMYGGYVVEDGPTREVLKRPRHPYTRGLMGATPDHSLIRLLEVMPGAPVDIADRPPGCPFAPRCDQKVPACDDDMPELDEKLPDHLVRCLEWSSTQPIDWAASQPDRVDGFGAGPAPVRLEVADLRAEHHIRGGILTAADGISFTLSQGECVALVGESGSGKTTIARTIAGLHPTWSGRLTLDGEQLAPHARGRSKDHRRRIQMVFQSPTDTLNPRHTVGETLARPARMLGGVTAAGVDAAVASLLDAVRLPARYANRYPRELSGGQRQRVAIARALAADPDIIICDEVTSALDVSVQARVLELLRELCKTRGVSLLFITHDLGVVATIASSVLVLEKGLICESGKTADLLANPQHEYTKSLLDAAPSLIASLQMWGVGVEQVGP